MGLFDMKVLALQGSPRNNGNTNAALTELGREFKNLGVEFEIFQIGNKPVRDCIACGACSNGSPCAFAQDGGVDIFSEKAKDASGIVIATPVYYAHPSGAVLSFLNRAFYSSHGAFAGKVGASIAIARRAGTCATFDVMNKYFGISGMPVAASTYWNVGFGRIKGEFTSDVEGVKTMHNLAKNMTWLMKSIEAGKQAGIQPPAYETGNMFNFIR